MSTNAQAPQRLDFVDAHRGIAVLLMLWMHSADGWLRPALKHGPTWDLIRSVGGLAAPTFLLLSGLGLTLAWGAGSGRGGARAGVARGLQLIVLGYGLRLYMWMLDGAGYRLAEAWAAALPLAAGYTALYYGLAAWGRGQRPRTLWVTAALGAGIGFLLIAELMPGRLRSLLRVDVLQAIGASLIVVTALRTQLQRWPGLGVGLAALVALGTPVVRAWMPGPLPPPLAGYVAQWDVPLGQVQPTLFPLFPWLAYALAGASFGLWLQQRRAGRGGGRDAGAAVLGLGAPAIAIALLTCEPLASGHALIAALPELAPVTRVLYRVAVSLVLGGAAVLLCNLRVPLVPRALVALGRASLVVYWVHLELAFGTAVKPIVHRLGFDQWALGLAFLAIAMTAFALGWVRFRTWLAARARSARTAHSAASDPAELAGT